MPRSPEGVWMCALWTAEPADKGQKFPILVPSVGASWAGRTSVAHSVWCCS